MASLDVPPQLVDELALGAKEMRWVNVRSSYFLPPTLTDIEPEEYPWCVFFIDITSDVKLTLCDV
jgi:hypothetical protein